MTQTEDRATSARPEQPVHRADSPVRTHAWSTRAAATLRRRPTPRLVDLLLPAGLLVLALALRWFRVESAYDVFIDEVTYRELAHNVATGAGVVLYGEPFTLHPPVSFLVLGGALRLLGPDLAPLDSILALRHVSAAAGALVVVAVWALARRVGLGRVPALVAGGLVAVDPFQISFDSRVLIEPFAQLFLLGCLLLLVTAARTTERTRERWATAGAAVLGGLTLSTKETFGMVLVGALAVLALWFGAAVRRRTTVTVLVGSIAGYALCSLAVASSYGFSTWWDSRTEGLARLVGTEQPTGFNSPTTQVTLTSRIAANAQDFAVTYGLLLLGGIATLVLLRRLVAASERAALRPDPIAVVLPAWSLAACGYLVYATFIGSIEEQMYYITLAPCVLTLVLWARSWAAGIGHRLAPVVVAVLVVVPVLFDVSVWHRTHTTDVDAYAAFVHWEADAITAGSRMAVTEGTAQFLVENAELGEWSTVREFRREDVDYVLVQTKLVREGYGLARPAVLARLEKQADVVFEAPAADGDRLVLFDVRPLTGGSS